MSIFHLAYTVTDLDSARNFYGELLGCEEGRSTETWVDFDFFGNQLSLHIGEVVKRSKTTSKVDDVSVPMPHFGCVLDWQSFHDIAEKLKSAGVQFIIESTIRFEGKSGEQATMFFEDPFQNALEFKAYQNPLEVFSK
tara:strand:+ start:123 stop:536 length:414 start_codon:yes stop_codon:yes gene_type:complete